MRDVDGRDAEPAAWEAAVDTAAATGQWMVQQHQDSWPYVFPLREGGWTVQNAVWGTFCIGDRYAGTVMRMGPRDGSGVLSVDLGATVGTAVEV